MVRCQGKIVAGGESESLHAHVNWLLLDRRSIVLHLGEVGFIDSSGLGTLVRALANTRKVRGELKLCNVPDRVRRMLDVTCLTKMFDLQESEEAALASFYGPSGPKETTSSSGRHILCLDSNADVLAYLRELLRRAGFEVQTTSLLGDARILLQVTHFDLLLVGPDKVGAITPLHNARPNIPIIELGSEFSTRDAGEAGSELLAMIEARLNPTAS